METHLSVNRGSRQLMLFLPILLMLLALSALACGVKSGDRGSARPGGESTEFHRSPVAALQQFRVDLTKSEAGCTANPADISVASNQRVRMAIQLPTEIGQSSSGSLTVTGDRDTVNYTISGLELASTAGAFGLGVTEFNLELDAGARLSYDFNTANTGAFDILCDGAKVGTFTVNPA